MKLFCALCLSILVLHSCKKDEYDVRYASAEYCHQNMVFTCDLDEDDPCFFIGKLNGDDFCLSATPGNDVLVYNFILNGVATTSVTSTETPTLSGDTPVVGSHYLLSIRSPIQYNLNGITGDFRPYIHIETPMILESEVFSDQYYIEEYFKEGILPLRTNYSENTEGFNFFIGWGCVYLPGYDHYYKIDPMRVPSTGTGLGPNFGPSPDSRLELVEMVKRETDEFIQYYLTFEVECELYYGGNYFRGEYFGHLTDGVFETIIQLDK